jgi:hypothetical protein
VRTISGIGGRRIFKIRADIAKCKGAATSEPKMKKAIKIFEVRRGSTEEMRYKIEVWFRGLLVDVFERETMREAEEAFLSAGYSYL